MRNRGSVFLAALALVAAACHSAGDTLVINGIKVHERYWYDAVAAVRPRAAFELACGNEQLGFALIRRGRRVPIEIAVAGCGRSALYVREEIGRYIGPWMLTAMHGVGVAAPEPAGVVAPPAAVEEPSPDIAPPDQYHL
jgi:hypothetical protein